MADYRERNIWGFFETASASILAPLMGSQGAELPSEGSQGQRAQPQSGPEVTHGTAHTVALTSSPGMPHTPGCKCIHGACVRPCCLACASYSYTGLWTVGQAEAATQDHRQLTVVSTETGAGGQPGAVCREPAMQMISQPSP